MEGLGLVAAGPRDIKSGNEYNHLIPQSDADKKVVQKKGAVDDVVQWAANVVKEYNHQTAKLATVLQGSSLKETLQNIFDFAYQHIQYARDRYGIEELRTPSRTWADRKSGVDCDDYTIFVSSIMYNLGIPFKFRITRYDGKDTYQHIYVIVPTDNGHITVDPVVDTFNWEKQYTGKKDFTMEKLGLAGLEGLDIAVLSGPGNTPDFVELTKLAMGDGLENAIEGLGSQADTNAALKKYLQRTRNAIASNPEEFSFIQHPEKMVEMFDYALKYWDTPKRDQALAILEEQEQKLIDQGSILLGPDVDHEDLWDDDDTYTGTEPELEGFEYAYADNGEWEEDTDYSAGKEDELEGIEYDYVYDDDWEDDQEYNVGAIDAENPEYEYLYYGDDEDDEEDFGDMGRLFSRKRRKKRRKKRKIRRAARADRRASRRRKRKTRRTARRTKRQVRRKKHGGFFKRVGRAAKKGAKKTVHAVVRFNPVTIAARGGVLLWLRTNVGKSADKLKYGYLTEAQAKKLNLNLNEYRKAKDALEKTKKLFVNALKGKKANLRKVILAKGRGKKIGLSGTSGVGELGVEPVTAAATGAAAAPFIVKIAKFLSKIGLDKMGQRMVEKSAERRTYKQQHGKDWRKQYRADRKAARTTVTTTDDQKQSKFQKLVENADAAASVVQKYAQPAETHSTVPGGGTVNQASIVPTGMVNKAMEFAKANPMKTAVGASILAYAVLPGFRSGVNNMLGMNGSTPVRRRPAQNALSGVSGKKTTTTRASKSGAKTKAKPRRRVKSIQLT